MKILLLTLLVSTSSFAINCEDLTNSIDRTSDTYQTVYQDVLATEYYYDEYMDAEYLEAIALKRIQKSCLCENLNQVDQSSPLFQQYFQWSLENTMYYDEYMDHDLIVSEAINMMKKDCKAN